MAPSPPVAQQQDLPCYTRQEIFTHRKLDDCWIAIHGEVYNVTSWLKRHPGGARLIMHYAGEDASVSSSVLAAVLISAIALRAKEGGAGLPALQCANL